MVSLPTVLASGDFLLALLLMAVAVRSRQLRVPDQADAVLLRQALERSRIQFAVLAGAWSAALTAVLLALYFDAEPERLELLILFSQAILLLLALLFELALYGRPHRLGAPQAPIPPQPEVTE